MRLAASTTFVSNLPPMHNPDAPPRKRWRIALWGIGVLIFAAVLYVAMVGPLGWWNLWHDRAARRYDAYYRTLSPLYQSPEIAKSLVDYENWWLARPAPRSWQRAQIVRELARLKEGIEEDACAGTQGGERGR